MPRSSPIRSCETVHLSSAPLSRETRIPKTPLDREIDNYLTKQECTPTPCFVPDDKKQDHIPTNVRDRIKRYYPSSTMRQKWVGVETNQRRNSTPHAAFTGGAQLILGSENKVLAVPKDAKKWPGELPEATVALVLSILEKDCATPHISALLADDSSRQAANQKAVLFVIGQILFLRHFLRCMPEDKIGAKIRHQKDALDKALEQILAAGIDPEGKTFVPKMGYGSLEEMACGVADARALELILRNRKKPHYITYLIYDELKEESERLENWEAIENKMPSLDMLLTSPMAKDRPAESKATLQVLLTALSRDFSGCPTVFYRTCSLYIASRLAKNQRPDLLPMVLKFAHTAPDKNDVLFACTKEFVEEGYIVGVRRCIEAGVSIHTRSDESLSMTAVNAGPSLLHLAVALGDTRESMRCQITKLLLENGANPFMLASRADCLDKPMDRNALTPINVVAFAAESGHAVLAKDLAQAQKDAAIIRTKEVAPHVELLKEYIHQARQACVSGRAAKNILHVFFIIYDVIEKLHLKYNFGAICEYTETIFRVLNQCQIFLEENKFIGLPTFGEIAKRDGAVEMIAQKKVLNAEYLILNNDHCLCLLEVLNELEKNFKKTFSDSNAPSQVSDNLIEIAINNLTSFSFYDLGHYGALETLVLNKKPQAIEIYMDSGIPISITSLCRAFVFAVRQKFPEPTKSKLCKVSPVVQALISHATSPQFVLALMHCAMLLRADGVVLALLKNAAKEKLPFLHVAQPEDAVLLHRAMTMGPDVLSAFMAALKEANLQYKWLTWVDEFGDNALFVAARSSGLSAKMLFQLAYDSNVLLSQTNVSGRTPVTEAMCYGNYTALKVLLDRSKSKWAECLENGLTTRHAVAALLEGFDASGLRVFNEINKMKQGKVFLQKAAVEIMMAAISTRRHQVAEYMVKNFKNVVTHVTENVDNPLHVIAKYNATEFVDLFATKFSTEELRSMSQSKGCNNALPEKLAATGILSNILRAWRHGVTASTHTKPANNTKLLTPPPPLSNLNQEDTSTYHIAPSWSVPAFQSASAEERNSVITKFLQQADGVMQTAGNKPNEVLTRHQQDCINHGWAIIDAIKKTDGGRKILGRHFDLHHHSIELSDLLERIKRFEKYGASRWGKNDSIAILRNIQRVLKAAHDDSNENMFKPRIQNIYRSGMNGNGFVSPPESNQIYYYENSTTLRVVSCLDKNGEVDIISFYPIPGISTRLLPVNDALQADIAAKNCTAIFVERRDG